MKYTRHYEKKQAIMRELRNYKGNKILLQHYKKMISSHDNNHLKCNIEQCKRDIVRVRGNMNYVCDLLHYLPETDRELMLDVFVREDLTKQEILEKYKITVAMLHYHADRCVSTLATMEFI